MKRKYVCNDCGEIIYENEYYYDIENTIKCESCAKDWLEEHREIVDEYVINYLEEL